MGIKKEIEGLLTENEVLEVSEILKKIVGYYPERVRNKPDYCNFPASKFLTENIHYEAIRHRKNGKIYCELHFECDAEELKEIIENDKRFEKVDSREKFNWYRLKSDTEVSIVDEFRNLCEVVNPIIKKYLDKYIEISANFSKAKQDNRDLYPIHQNFFEMFSGRLSENEHTKILLALLKTETENKSFKVLASFCKEFGIDVDISNVEQKDFVFSKRYDDEDGLNFIDGLVYREREYAIIIENKIYGAGDQPQQIERYIKAVNKKENILLENIWVVYVTDDGTLHGGRPTNDSYDEKNQETNIGDRLVCINYHDDILPWLKEKVMPIIKYSYASVGCVADCYIDYLERMFGEDAVGKILTESVKFEIFNDLGINGETDVVQYNTMLERVKPLSIINKEECKEYRDRLLAYMRELERPVYDEFEKATIQYFKENGNEVVLNNRLSSGYIQIIGAGWNRLVHYEWCPSEKARSFFFGTDDLPLCIHYERKYRKKRKSEKIMIKHKESIAEMMKPVEFKKWLATQYDQVIKEWDDMERIATLEVVN